MKKILYRPLCFLQLFCLTAMLALLSACQKEEVAPPVITEIRNYAASPSDTVLQTLNAGQWVVVLGKNLSGVTQVLFGNTPATINQTLLTDQSIVVQIPAIPFQSVPKDKLNVLTVINSSGIASYEINITGAPIISHVRNHTDNDESIIESVVPNQKINIVGFNLKNATRIAFQGVDADLTSVVYTDSSAIVQVPAELSGGDAALVNTITYVNKIGTGSFAIRIIGPPIITRVSYEMPNEGDQVILFGNNLFAIQNLTFAGAAITTYEESADGSSIQFTAPQLTQKGPVVVTTPAGTFTSAYNVNDKATGNLSDFEWGDTFQWEWWGGAELTSSDPNSGWPPYNADFQGNTGMYLVLKTNVLNGGAGDEFANAIRIPSVQWVPAGNLSDPLSSWALKFEVNVPKPWNGATLSIKSSNDSYRALYQPWQISSTATAAYSTSGWQTVTIPLSAFRADDGKGDPVASITALLGNTGKSNLVLYVHNYGTAPTKTAFYAAFDNFRVVKR